MLGEPIFQNTFRLGSQTVSAAFAVAIDARGLLGILVIAGGFLVVHF